MVFGSCGTVLKLLLGVWLTSIVFLQLVVHSQPQLSSSTAGATTSDQATPIAAENANVVPEPVTTARKYVSSDDNQGKDESDDVDSSPESDDNESGQSSKEDIIEDDMSVEEEHETINAEPEVLATEDEEAVLEKVEEQNTSQPTWQKLTLSGSGETLLVQPEPLARIELESPSSIVQVMQSVDYQGNALDKIVVVDQTVLIQGEQDIREQSEILAHAPMMDHPKPQKVLIMGDTTVGVVHEALKHASVKRLDHVASNPQVMELIKATYFPDLDNHHGNSQYTLHDTVDSMEFLQSLRTREKYDVIVYVPSPSHPTSMTEEWWSLARQHLTRQGVLLIATREGNEGATATWMDQAATSNFQTIRGGPNFLLCNPGKKSGKPLKSLPKRLSKLGDLQYYSPDIQACISVRGKLTVSLT